MIMMNQFFLPFFKLLLLLLLSFFCTVCTAQERDNSELLANDVRLSQFAQFLDMVGISPDNYINDIMNDNNNNNNINNDNNIIITGKTTILAPTNNAWNMFQNEDPFRWNQYTTKATAMTTLTTTTMTTQYSDYSNDYYYIHLRDLLEWHFVIDNAYLWMVDIFNGQRTVLPTRYGGIKINQSFRQLNGIPQNADQYLVESDISTIQGLIHILDQVMIPPYLSMNVMEQLFDDDRNPLFSFSIFANLALAVGMEESLNDRYENGLTILVPPNRRIARAEVDIPLLLSPNMRNYTRDFISCHMVLDNYHEKGVFAYNNRNNNNNNNNKKEFLVQTFLGTHLWITTNEDQLRFQSVEVLIPDQATDKSIFHIIGEPLFPPTLSHFAKIMHISTSWDISDCDRFFRSLSLTSLDISMMVVGYEKNITLWCPTREAFAQFNNEAFNRLLEPFWVRHATEFLLNHISTPALTQAEWVDQYAPGTITMLNGATYELRSSGGGEERDGRRPRIIFNDDSLQSQQQARTEFGDIIAIDGYLHILDNVITPTAVTRSILDQLIQDPDFTIFLENIDFTVSDASIIDRDLPLTVFAPNNNAWRRIVFNTLSGLEIIRRHIFRGLLFTDILANLTSTSSSEITSVNGDTLPIEVRGEGGGPNSDDVKIFVGGAYIYQGDILANNGVVHYIDRVIGEPYPTLEPTTSPAPTITVTPTRSPVLMPAPISPRPVGSVPIGLPPITATTQVPTNKMTEMPTARITETPSRNPSELPSTLPSQSPSTSFPSTVPSDTPSTSIDPSQSPSEMPSTSMNPTMNPTIITPTTPAPRPTDVDEASVSSSSSSSPPTSCFAPPFMDIRHLSSLLPILYCSSFLF